MSTIPVLDNQAGDDPFRVGTVADARWADAEKTMIQCTITFPSHPLGFTQPMPFTADPRDTETHGQAIFYRLRSGEFGRIGEYQPPPDAVLDAQAQVRAATLITETQPQIEQYRDELESGGVTSLSASQFTALQTYRTALRNINRQPKYPKSIEWPKKPF